MPASPDATARHHLPRLDSLRGIGALMVGGFHSGLNGGTTVAGQALMYALGFFFDGRTGVSIFFVLSGLVLGQSLRRSGGVTPATYFHFCGRRFFRLYPAYFVSTMFYLLLFVAIRHCFVHGVKIGSGWCDYYEQSTLAGWHLVENFCFANQSLNVASWTLKVEAQAAFLLPVLHAISLRFRRRGEAMLLLALMASACLTKEGPTRENLYLGYLIPPVLERLRTTRAAEFLAGGGLITAVALAVLAAAHLFTEQGLERHIGLFLAATGSTLLLMAVMSAPALPIFSLLDWPVVRFAGTVSYSFYLYNLLCVDATQRAWSLIAQPGLLAWWIIFPVSSLLCLGLSALSFYLVERPGIRVCGFLFPSIHRGESTETRQPT